jgi:hypothetical protein
LIIQQKTNKICKNFQTHYSFGNGEDIFYFSWTTCKWVSERKISRPTVTQICKLLGGGKKAAIPIILDWKNDLTEGTTMQYFRNN